MAYIANNEKYNDMIYKKVGSSGLKLPVLSLGLWHNFGTFDDFENMRKMCQTAFDSGITHYDIANNYGPLPGSAEENFGKILNSDFSAYRDELIISTKAGFGMWNGPYGSGGSRKHLISSLDQSLKRLNLDYVDIFYHHAMDKDTPIEESMLALNSIVKSGKALYVGLSNYDGENLKIASGILKDLKCPFIINQNRYNIFDRTIENNGLMQTATKEKLGIIVFSPLEQGLLSDRYLNGIQKGSRATKNEFLKESQITKNRIDILKKLKDIALSRGQTLSQMSLNWVLKNQCVNSAIIGASCPEQILENVKILKNMQPFSSQELEKIDKLSIDF